MPSFPSVYFAVISCSLLWLFSSAVIFRRFVLSVFLRPYIPPVCFGRFPPPLHSAGLLWLYFSGYDKAVHIITGYGKALLLTGVKNGVFALKFRLESPLPFIRPEINFVLISEISEMQRIPGIIKPPDICDIFL